MRLFDSHCHLDDKRYRPDLQEVLNRAREAGVERCMVVGIDPDTAREAIRIAEDHSGVVASVGIHPHDAARCSKAVLECCAHSTNSTPRKEPYNMSGKIVQTRACVAEARIRI